MKTWLITGCSSGLGRSLAKEALKQGYQVVVTARDTDKIKDIVERYPHTALSLPLDVTDQKSIDLAVQKAINQFGQVDVLVNNAGYGYRSAVEEGDMLDVARLFQTNVWGPVALIKALLPTMRKQQSGLIINVSSIAAISASMGSGYYAASKSALESLSEALVKEVKPLGIQVMIVEPGAFRTDFAGRSLTESKIVIDDYAGTSGTRRIGKENKHGTQPGNPDKAAEMLIKIIQEGHLPLRLLLGSDAVQFADEQMKKRQKEYHDWHLLSEKTDY